MGGTEYCHSAEEESWEHGESTVRTRRRDERTVTVARVPRERPSAHAFRLKEAHLLEIQN